jgi:ligand-binding SRPBCC domain-containing protein
MRVRVLETEVHLPHPVEEVFAFFSDPANLQTITPPWLHFRILETPQGSLMKGSLLHYRIRWRWVPLRWTTVIDEWEPPYRFVDRQLRGPYRQWIHTHTFEPSVGGTLMRDRVEYAVPGWVVEPVLNRFVVRPDLDRIFDYRRLRMLERFPSI